MVRFADFAGEAPRIAEVFTRRHAATGNLCFLGTLRADGSPRISPMEPKLFEGELVLVGMPNTLKFRDLERDPRFDLHTATVDTHVTEGDAKLWGRVHNVQDREFHARFLEDLFEESGFDLRGEHFDPFFVADLEGGSAVEFKDGLLTITIWRPGEGERSKRLA